MAGGAVLADEVVSDEEAFDDEMEEDSSGGGGDALSGQSGWVIEIQAHHFHNFKGDTSVLSDMDYVRSTIVKELSDGEVVLPDGTYKFSDLGVTFPTVVRADEQMRDKFIEFDPAEARKALNGFDNGGRGGRAMDGKADKRLADGETTFSANLFCFVVQMAWQPRSPQERLEARNARLKNEQEDAEAKAKTADGHGASGGDEDLQ